MANENIKSNKSALVIIPPEEVWPQIQDIRSKHDKSYKRWMPHINLIYPFIKDDEKDENFKSYAEKINFLIKAENVKSFKIIFDSNSFQHFKHKSNCTLWLKPLKDVGAGVSKIHDDIEKLQSLVEKKFPEYDDLSNIPPNYTYTPHLSLGQFNFKDIESVTDKFKENWNKIEFVVDHIYMISRQNFESSFEIKQSLKLN